MTESEKHQALDQVLDSQSFARSEQLKKFLRYVCELEIAGRSGEIKEYSIGTEALGRPQDYSPTQDSSVRRRAFELRAKLDEIYQGELAGAPVVIELPKGSYVPVFRPRDGSMAPAPIPAPALAEPPLPAGRFSWRLAGALTLGLVLGAALMRWMGSGHSVDAVLREAWGPIATEGNVLICLATPFHMAVRPGTFSPEADLPVFPAPEEIGPLFQKTNPRPGGAKLLMRPALNTVSLGALGAVVSASARLQSLGVQSQVLPERTAPLASFRNRNVILIGDPLNSYAAEQLLHQARLTIEHDQATGRLVIRDRTQPPGERPAFVRETGKAGGGAVVYGLLTVRPGDSAPGLRRRTLIVSGLSNVGVQGAMEFFASAERLRELRDRFQREGKGGFPESYQVVVRCMAQDSLPLSCDYAAHYDR